MVDWKTQLCVVKGGRACVCGKGASLWFPNGRLPCKGVGEILYDISNMFSITAIGSQ